MKAHNITVTGTRARRSAVGLLFLSCILLAANINAQETVANGKQQTPQSVDVILETSTGKLSGTLMVPPVKVPMPVVLLVAGSGMTDRDGNTVGLKGKSDCLKMLAAEFAKNGIASLRYDKRGVAASAGARAVHNTFDIQVDDAAGWVQWLGRDPRFTAIGVIGHSEGATIGTIAAQRGKVRAFVSLAGAGRRFDEVMTGQIERAIKAGQLPKNMEAPFKACMAELREGRPVTTRPSHIPDEFWNGLFNPRAQEYLITLFKYDPETEIAKLRTKEIQVLVVRGTTDLMGGDDEADRLATAAGVKAVVIEGMNHELKPAPLDRAANDKVSDDPRVPLSPGLVDKLIPFISAALR